MRRTLLGGLGIALGVMGRPAFAQESPTRGPNGSYSAIPARTEAGGRKATLGRPTAGPDTPPGAVTPAGLTARGQIPTAPVYTSPAPVGVVQPAPVYISPAPVYASPAPVGVVQPAPLPLGYPSPVVNNGFPPIVTGTPSAPQPGTTPQPKTGSVPPAKTPPGPTLPGMAVPGMPPMVTVERDPTGRVGASPAPGVGVPIVIPPGTPGYPIPSVVPGDVPGYVDDPLGGAIPGAGAITRVAPGGSRAWLGAEYLAWWTRSTQLPVLAATGVAAPATPGALLGSSVPILSGPFGQTLHGGARFSAGYWFGDDQRRGIDARFLFLFRNGSSFNTNSNDFPVLGRPFFNINPNVPIAGVPSVGVINDLIAAPGVAIGGLAVQTENSLWGAEVNYRRNLWSNPCWGCFRLDALVGYRYLNFKEQLTITEAGLLTNPPAPATPTFGYITDRFRAENNFHGGQIGLVGELKRGRWFVNSRATIAFGTVFQTAEISGTQAFAATSGLSSVANGGLLAIPGANVGTFTQNRFAVLPEVGINLGYQVTPHLRIFGGYNFLYLSSVLRPANVINPYIDAARIPNFTPTTVAPVPGVPQPTPLMRATDFFAQGISFGLQWNFGYTPR